MVSPSQQRVGTVGHVGRSADLRGRFVLCLYAVADPFGVHLVEPRGEPFREPSGIGENDARSVFEDEIDHLLLDMRPDRSLSRWRSGGVGIRVADAQLGHVLHGHLNRQVEGLRSRWGDDLDGRCAGKEAAHFFVWSHGRRQADALGGFVQHRVEPLQGHRQVRATFGARYGMDLVDDHGVDLGKDVSRGRGEHEKQ